MADKNLEISTLLDHYGEMLTDKQREVIDLYYNDDLSLAEIAEQEGISRQGVRDNIKRAEGQLLEMENALHCAERFRQMMKTFDEVDTLLQEIEQEYTSLRRVSGVRRVQQIREKLTSFADGYFN
jgi:hypothetical protein